MGNFKYHIKFPTTTPNFENEQLFVSDEGKSPVVISFGWVGCQDKHLAKYSSIYEDRGCIILRYTAPAPAVFWQHGKLSKHAAKLLNILQEKKLDEHPIIFHVFSNGGAFFYQLFSMEMQKQNKTPQIKGVIFDSGPGFLNFSSVYRTFRAIIGGPVWYNVPVSLLMFSVVIICFFISAYAKALIELKWPQTEPIILGDEPYNWPQMFIYSKDDELIRYEDVEKFSEQRKERGVKVTKLCLEKSPHVQHLITHGEIYINAVFNFAQTCLNEQRRMDSGFPVVRTLQ